MKKSWLFFVLLISILTININFVYAENLNNGFGLIRAGGGNSSSSSSSGGSTSHPTGKGGGSYYCPYGVITCTIIKFIYILISICFIFITSIILYIKLLRSSINSKKYLKMLSKKDITWKYKDVEKQVINTFYVVQEAWTNMDMKSAKKYMSKDLYQNFDIKLKWLEVANKRNILKRIKLIDLHPVSVYDDKDDSKDLIWFYIKGSMVDYTINTKTNEKIEGNSLFSLPFVEFWCFKRKKDKWVLSKIIQKDESNKIVFQ